MIEKEADFEGQMRFFKKPAPHWYHEPRPSSVKFYCSECFNTTYFHFGSRGKEPFIPYNFCPYCGAKMEGELEEYRE